LEINIKALDAEFNFSVNSSKKCKEFLKRNKGNKILINGSAVIFGSGRS
jgi:hypothetical protein